MKRALTFIFGLILMVAPFAPSTAATSTPTVTVIGIVHDENNNPLPGATVVIDETTKGMITDENGSFTFPNVSTDATIKIEYVGYKDVYIELSEKTPTDNTINLGTITLEGDGLMEEVIISSYPLSSTTPEHATKAIIYNEEIGFNPSTERDAATLTNTDTRNKRNDKNVICKCANNYILMNRNHQSFTGRITLTKSTPQTVSYDSQNPNGICDQGSLAGATENEYLLLLATELHDAGLQCVAPTNCSRARNVTKSHYELDGTQYKCIVDTCSTGYTPNEAKDGCEEVEDCKNSLANQTGVKVATYRGNGSNRICVVTECECGYDISDDQKSCTVWNQYTCSNRTKIPGATRMQRFCDDETEVCTALECDTENYKKTELTDHNYRLPQGISKLYICEEHAKQCTEAQRNANTLNLQNASKSKPIIDTTKNDGSQICIPTKCVCGYDLTDPDTPNAKCTAWGANEPCRNKPKNAADNQYFRRCRGKNNDQEYCHIADCTDGYLPNDDNDRCVLDRKSGECAPENNNNVRYAKWRKKNGKYMCIIIECVRGYEPNDAGTACIAKIVLPEDKSAERINELQGVYDEAKKNEISDANKILGGASMGATGAGGMMLGMGLAEQKADNAAYEQMRGYVSTFKCNYGANNIEYSVEPTQLPTSTELTNLYAEYVTLANDLKMRKSVLGLRAGLESQPILDSATSGLYDDVSSGRETGTFTSLARAILDPDGEDAKRWAEQTKKSKNLIIAGGVTAGVGAVGGIVGNLLINKDAPNLQSVREKIDDINKKYAEFYKEFERAADDLGGTLTVTRREEDPKKKEDQPAPTDNNGEPPMMLKKGVETEESDDQLNDFCKSCPRLISTGPWPNCICSDITKRFNKMTCQCEDVNVASIEVPPVRLPVPTGIIPLGGTGDSLTAVGGVTQLTPLQIPTDITLSIPGSTLFDTGKHYIKESAKASLQQLIDALNTLNTTLEQTSYNVTVTGHTDTEGGKNSNGNKNLSERRANAVKDLLGAAAQRAGLTLNITPSGKAGTECTCASGLTEDSTEAEFSIRASMTCQKTVHPFDNPQCCANATDYAAAKDKDIPDDTKFEPCRRVDITFTLPTTEASSLADYGITGIGNITLTMEDIQRLADQATTGTE